MWTLLRARLEGVLAIASALVAQATVVSPHWIEDLTGLEPDGGSGSAEWGTVVVLRAVSAAAAALARLEIMAHPIYLHLR